MERLSTTIAAYDHQGVAERDWAAVESAGRAGWIDLVDATLVKGRPGATLDVLHRRPKSGWGRGAVAGAVLGLLSPLLVLDSAAISNAGRDIVACLSRNLDRGDLKDLGDVMDSGRITMAVVTDQVSVTKLTELLGGAKRMLSRPSSSAEELRNILGPPG